MNRYTVNPDEVYDVGIFKETPDDFLERIRHKEIERYAVQVIQSGEWAEIKIFPQWKKREYVPKKGQKTREAQQKLNHKNAVHKLTRILNCNFAPYRDKFVTFTCDNEHLVLTDEEGFEMAEKGIRRIKYQYKKAGVPLTAVYKVEIKRAKDSDGFLIRTADGRQLYRPHLHIVLNSGVNPRKLLVGWKLGRNRRIEDLRWEPEGFLKLAAYLCKDTKAGKRRWSGTNNLIKPPPPRTVYTSKAGSKTKVGEVAGNHSRWKEYFEAILPGYDFVQNETSMNEYCSGVYMHARMALKYKED